MSRCLGVLLVGLASLSHAQAPAAEAQPSLEPTVVTNLEANKVATEVAPGLSQSITQRFKDAGLPVISHADLAATLTAERQRQLLGCSEGSCYTELSDALGARYVVNGRVDRFGQRFVLNVTLFDTRANQPLVKSSREVPEADDLLQAIQEVADELVAAFGVPPKVAVKLADRVSPRGFNLSLKLGTQLLTSILALSPGGDLELGYRLSLRWALFLQVSFGVVFGVQSTFAVRPGVLGVRYHFRADKSLQPTVGTGVGVLTTIDAIRGLARPSLMVLAGLTWFITSHWGVGLEASVDALGLAFGFAQSTNPGVAVGLSLGVTYRF